MLYAALQGGPQLLPEEQMLSHGLTQGSLTHLPLTAKLSGNFWRPLPRFHAADRHVQQSYLVKRQIQLAQVSTWIDNFSWATSPYGPQQFWCHLPARPGQVQTSANHYSQFFSLEHYFSDSFTFHSDKHGALRAEGRLCWTIKPKAAVGAMEDQTILMEENLWNCSIKSQVEKQEEKSL